MLVVPQSFGNLLNPHAHLHALCSRGVFDQEGAFHLTPDDLDFSPLEELFAQRTPKMLLKREAITAERIALLRSWQHSGFNLNTQRRVEVGERKSLEALLA